MIQPWVILAGLVWVACGVLTYGLVFAYFQRGFPTIAKENYRIDLAMAITGFIVGPIGLGATLLSLCFFWNRGYQGFKWR